MVNRTGLTLGTVMLLAIINMLVSFLTAESVDNDAVRINLAGSLRMQSYRIAEALIIGQNKQLNPGAKNLLEERIIEFEERFYRPVLSQHINQTAQPELIESMDALETHWYQLKAKLNAADNATPALLADIDAFVGSIDQLVKFLERQTESKFKLLRLLQGISLLVTAIVVVLVYADISSNVVGPLKRLLSMANRVRGGDFSVRIEVKGDDELSLLSSTFNEMTESLEAKYQDLENKVSEKTQHLEDARDGLSLLYTISRALSGDGSASKRIEQSLARINDYLSGADVAVDFAEHSPDRSRIAPQNQVPVISPHQYKFCIARQSRVFGELQVTSQQVIVEEKRNLLQAIADNIAAALSAEWQQDQQHRLILMEERTVMARELHDSLAQSLSYLKIQISRMQMLRARANNPEELDSTVTHIKTGIDAAYRQLRELLATFRLQLAKGGLEQSLQDTVAEFSERGEVSISLIYDLKYHALTPNEEIHVLQIVRESLSNVVRHSNAGNATVSIKFEPGEGVTVIVSDSGCGFIDKDCDSSHYGKIIMAERAKTLDGNINFSNNEAGGALVTLSFLTSAEKSETNLAGEQQ